MFHVADMTSPVTFVEQLTPFGTLSGRVFDGEGRPALGVRMEMLRARGGGLSIVVTDAEGRFVLRSLLPGAYVLLARPMLPGSGGDEHSPTSLTPPTAPEGSRLTWAATYYPGTTERSGAQNIVIHGGSNLTAFDIRLRAAPLWRIRGVVLDDQAKPAAGVDVTLHSSETLTEPEARTQTSADGSFELSSVCPGEWRIRAEIKHGTVAWRGSTPVSVVRRDVEGVSLRVAPPFPLDAFVERGDPRSPFDERSPVTLQLVPVDASPDRQVSADERSDGSLRIPAVHAGRYRIQAVGMLPGAYLEAIRLGVTDVTGQPVDLAPGAPPLRLIYKSAAGRAVGLVENGWGATVVLAPKDELLRSAPFLRAIPASMDGRFDAPGMRPGDYYLWAFDRVDLAALSDPDFVRALMGTAETVHIPQGQVVIAPNLKVTAWPE